MEICILRKFKMEIDKGGNYNGQRDRGRHKEIDRGK
jgi:hypothetical protein